jgi:FtsH ternary system-associated peptide
MPADADVAVVSRFEADLLTILQGFLGHVPRSQVLPLLLRPGRQRPKCLGSRAVALIEDTLAKGATLVVAQDGWRRERFLRDGLIADGRLWERTNAGSLGLSFSGQSLDFLMWLAAAQIDKTEWQPPKRVSLALGDRLLLALAYETVRDTAAGRLWTQREPWRSDGLCQLLYAADFSLGSRWPDVDFASWLSLAGVAVLEAWQRRLEERWVQMELARSKVTRLSDLAAIGANQRRVLGSFLEGIDRAGRRDLARFLLGALSRLLTRGAKPKDWLGEVTFDDARLAERQQTSRDALVVVESMERLARWQTESVNTGYFDDGYQAAQLWKSIWEAYNGDSLLARARSLLDQNRWV